MAEPRYWRPISPIDGIHVFDDFFPSTEIAPADHAGTKLLWEIATLGNASTVAYQASPYGILRLTTNATADGDGAVLHSDQDMVYATAGEGGIAFRVGYPAAGGNQLAGNNFRIGFSASITATAPTDSICVESDAGVITLRVDSADHGDVSQAAAGVSTLTSGTTMVLGQMHLFEIRWSGENGQGGPRNVELWIDNEPAASVIAVIDDDESMDFSIAHWQDTGGAADLEFDIDFIEYWHWRPTPVTAPAV
jgi:hypothetical protein